MGRPGHLLPGLTRAVQTPETWQRRRVLWVWDEVGEKTGLCFKKSSALSSGEKEADQQQGAPQETQGVPVFIPVLGSSRVTEKGKSQHTRAAVPEPEDWLLR